VASTTIIAPASAQALQQAREAAERSALLEGYEIFRRIKDDYEEAARPSADDVESVLSVVASALAVGAGQLEWDSVTVPGVQTFPGGFSGRFTKSIELAGQGFTEGRTWYLRLSPGVMGLRCTDENKKEKADQRAKDAERKAADIAALFAACLPCPLFALRPSGGSTGEIREWSPRSRSRMSELVGSLDYSEWSQKDGALAMVTLTLPGDWLTVAPDGKTFKKLLRRFELRWRRTVGDWRCLWKLEFQRRGAPHWHGLMRVPALVGRQTFEEWLSATWADCVAHPDPIERMKHEKAGTGVDFSGKDFSDPRRISLYFLGHSSKTTDGKEYQHRVPEEWQVGGKGPGRFWGNPGLSSASREIEITERDAVQAARVLRKVKRGRAWEVAVLRERGNLPVGERTDHKTFCVELRQKAGQKRGRSAHRTFNRKLREAAEAKGEYSGFKISRARFVPSSLGGGGYAVGGWVLVNDGLQLGLDVARYFEWRAASGFGSPLSTGTDAKSRNDDRPARLAAVRLARQQRLERAARG
jgi:hypothetical protein